MLRALMLFPLLFQNPQTAPSGSAYLQAPADRQPAQVRPGETTILPNGRFLTPKGRRLYTGGDLWQVLLSPNQKTVIAIHDGGFTLYTDATQTNPERKAFPRRKIAPAGAFTADGSRLVLSLGDAGSIEVLDTNDFSTLFTISADADGIKDSYINDLALSADGKYAYGVDIANQRVVTFDLAEKRVVASVKAGRQPYAVTLAADGKSLYVANIGLFDYALIPAPRTGSESQGNRRGLSRPPFAFPGKESETGVEAEGRFVPGIGSPQVPDAQSVYQYSLTAPDKPTLTRTAKSGILIHAPADGGKAVGGSAPNALLLRGNRLYVSNANNDTVQVFDAATLKSLQTMKLSPSPLVARLRGVIPSGMALSKDGKRLYVCESGLNAVAVLDTATGKTLGHIPTGWFPMQVRLSADEKTLYIATQKGLGRGPRGPKTPQVAGDERDGLSEMPGMVNAVPVPNDAELTAWTQETLRNNGIVNRAADAQALPKKPLPVQHGTASAEIKYVVFITKENHTFDGIFGALKGANGEPDYAEFGQNGWIAEKGKTERLPIMPNHIRLAEQYAISDNFYMEPQASGDGHRWLVGVYPSLWTTRVFYSGWDFRRSNTAKGRLTSFGSNGSQMPEDYLENGSLWEHLARGGVTFRNYGEGWEFPGTDEGEKTDRSGSFLVVNHPMSRVLWENTCWEFPIFNTNIPDIARVEWFKDDLENNFRKKGKPIPRMMNITLCNDHGTTARPKAGYPYVCSYMADNDLALGRLVEYLSHLPEWKNMAIFVTQDDSGGDNDHVDRHRSYVLAISPYAKRGGISHDHTSIMSILKTIYLIFGLGANNMFDALATDLRDMFTDKPDYTPYTHVAVDPRVFKPEATIDPNDPQFKKRRQTAPSVRMDDPKFIEWLRTRKPTVDGEKD